MSNEEISELLAETDDLVEESKLAAQTEKEKEAADAINAFPVAAFPVAIQKIISETNSVLTFPVDFIATALIFAASVAIGNSYRGQLKKGMEASAVVYIVQVGSAGTNKTHPLNWAIAPIFKRDKASFHQYKQDKKRYDEMLEAAKAAKETPCDNAADPPKYKRFLITDFTPEAMLSIHDYNKRGIGVYSDEIVGWVKNFNRYNKSNEMEFWLSNWSGSHHSVERKGSEPILIAVPFISVAGGIQPAILKEFKKDGREHNGFVDRILFAYPDGLKTPKFNAEELQDSTVDTWENLLCKILELDMPLDNEGNPSPIILKVAPDALEIYIEWQHNNADISDLTENEGEKGINAKLQISITRMALIIQLLRYACGEADKREIDIESMRRAILLIEYFRKCALKVNAIINGNVATGGGDKKRKMLLYQEMPDVFTTSEGKSVAEKVGIPLSSFSRYLDDEKFYRKIKRGSYEKVSNLKS